MEQATSLGPYRIESLLGRGGMGAVYRAFDTRRGRRVALKLLNSDIAQDPGYRERFRRESRLAAQLNSPHVIPIHDFGELDDGQLFIDMRLCDGVDLGRLVEAEGPLEPRRAVEIVSQLAEALGVAHREGLVHRDVKPANAIVESHFGRDFVYLVDFGIVRALDGGSATNSLSLTATGALVGTMPYMAPELFGADTAPTPRVDVYALGCLFYEILVGRRAYDASNLGGLIHQHLSVHPAPPSTRRPGIPPTLDGVIGRALHKAPEQRWPDTDTFGLAARNALENPSGHGGGDPTNARPQAAIRTESPRPGPAPAAVNRAPDGRTKLHPEPAPGRITIALTVTALVVMITVMIVVIVVANTMY